MKVKLFFDSRDEFVEFVLSASSIHFGSEFQVIKKRKNRFDGFDFLELVPEVEVEKVRYSVARASSDQKAEYTIINYMLNDVQIKNDLVFFTTNRRGREGAGSQDIMNLFTKLPESFILRVGWRTDYEEFIFRKQD